MWWALLALLSCFTVTEHSYYYGINGRADAFVVGKPQKKAKWQYTPDIRICRDTGVSMFRMNHAISFWQKLGYKFGAITMDNSISCMNAKYGEILVTLPDSGFNNNQIASTRLYSSVKTGDVVKAKIFIMPKDAKRTRVLEHELGHALGWSHYNKKFHIMHSSWILGGTDASGLRNID